MPGHDPTRSPPDPAENGGAPQSLETMFSPTFKSVAAMAGWDEESILLATLVVEDTPDRNLNLSKRRDPLFKAPPPSTDSKRKRSGQRRNPISIHVPILNLDDDDEPPPIQEVNVKKKKDEGKVVVKEEEVEEKNGVIEESSCSNAAVLPCLDKLREELSCAICLEICFEPSTTSCGHSFCKKCLRSAADKCGKKCPKCRQLISNGRSCTVNTVLWNTIQLLFPKEVEARKVAEGKERVKNEIRKSSRGVNPSEQRILTRVQNQDTSAVSWRLRRQESSNADEVQNQDTSAVSWRLRRQESSNADEDSSALAGRSRRTSRAGGGHTIRSTDGDSALALRLQRQEFNGETDEGPAGRRALSRARANLRAMASRAVSARSRTQLYL